MHKNYGGKANSLMKLKDHQFPVPDFFVIDCKDYEYFLKYNNLFETVKIFIEQQKYLELQKLILESEIPKKLKTKIDHLWNSLNVSYVSVRSSATNEDGQDKSFAGQYETFLNISYQDLYHSIKKCWCSLYNENVVLYFEKLDLYGMNVIVQEMIYSDFAGVAFSKDVTSSTENYSVIEMVKGCGEQLVSGSVTPTKFMIRRETLYVDLKVGNISVDFNVLEQLETILLKIEELYGRTVDVEYAILNKKIYILQARPITATSMIPIPYSLAISRPKSILEEEIYFIGEFEGIQRVTRNLYYFKPLFLYHRNKNNVGVYYNELDLEEDPRMMYYYMDLDFDKMQQYYEKIKVDVQYLKNIIDKKLAIDIDEYVDRIVSIYPFSSLGQLVGHFDQVSLRIRNLLCDFRNCYDDVIHQAIDYLMQFMKDDLSDEFQDFLDFITLEEYKTKQIPSKKELEKRKKGYIYFGKLYVTEDYDEWFQKHNRCIRDKEIQDVSTNEFIGQIAYAGTVVGKVCKVFSERDFCKFQKGDILVTPMTVPKFIKTMKEASAIVTDEGGITCHAAIISREMKIPCVVGCQNVTECLKDGDVIKVNANCGKIEIISR